MRIRRRAFLAASSGTLFGFLGLDLRVSTARAQAAIVRRDRMTTTICPYCAVGCGVLVSSVEGKVVHVEGDPDHPINAGSLCAKGMAMLQVANNRPPADQGQATGRPGPPSGRRRTGTGPSRRIAAQIKQSRDATFMATDAEGRTVNRTAGHRLPGRGRPGQRGVLRLWQAGPGVGHRVSGTPGPGVPQLDRGRPGGQSFGRGAMTNHWIDVANSDCIMIIGSNAAENHPLAFKWILKARERGAKLISVDPRFTRTSAIADIYAPLRPGTDIAFIGGLIRYALEHERISPQDYLAAHTNAGFLVDPEFAVRGRPLRSRSTTAGTRGSTGASSATPRAASRPTRRLQTRTACSSCSSGTTPATRRRWSPRGFAARRSRRFEQVAETFCATCRPGPQRHDPLRDGHHAAHPWARRTSAAYAVLQLLLGNIGVAGGGINACAASRTCRARPTTACCSTSCPAT